MNRFLISPLGLALCLTVIYTSTLNAQTKRIKRPKSTVGISSVDSFVGESFDLYDKVYKYDAYAASGTPLADDDIDVLDEAISEVNTLTTSAPKILSDLDGAGLLKQGKATLQINKAKQALAYSLKTAKKLLLGQKEQPEKDNDTTTNPHQDSQTTPQEQNISTAKKEPPNISDNLNILSKFDFVPGDKVLFFDDFSQDFVGDFPLKWNTNASGEIAKINQENWFELKSGYNTFYIPDLKGLPEDYTIEFDLLTQGLDKKTSSTSKLTIYLSDNNGFEGGQKHYVQVELPFGQYLPFAMRAYNFFNGSNAGIKSSIKADIRNDVLNQPHISISVTKNRFRLWINQTKHIDIPRFIEQARVLNYLKFNIHNINTLTERIFIKNLKVAEGGVDLRRKLLSEGKISTNGILFDSGSATIKRQSYGIIKQISQVLQQDQNIQITIIGHTDADGDANSNLTLSKARATAVKQALVEVYKIDKNRLTTDGKGETQPVADNTSAEGKAKNRRVEFIKQ